MATTRDEHTIRIEHHLAAAPHLVYRAWLEPGLVRQWMAPAGRR